MPLPSFPVDLHQTPNLASPDRATSFPAWDRKKLTAMRVLKALRRSIKGDKENKPPHIAIAPKSAVAIVPPKKVRCMRLAPLA